MIREFRGKMTGFLPVDYSVYSDPPLFNGEIVHGTVKPQVEEWFTAGGFCPEIGHPKDVSPEIRAAADKLADPQSYALKVRVKADKLTDPHNEYGEICLPTNPVIRKWQELKPMGVPKPILIKIIANENIDKILQVIKPANYKD